MIVGETFVGEIPNQSTKQNILPNIPQDKELPPIPNTIYPNTRTINNDNSNSLSLYICNRYELISPISKSKHNKVYLGRHILTSDKIVVKFYKYRSRWENEIHFLKALTSKYTVKLEEITVNPAEGQKYFIITRYFGKSLDEIANNICDNEAHIKSVLLGTCKAVEWCHNKGVVHMDLNPSNIIWFTSPELLFFQQIVLSSASHSSYSPSYSSTTSSTYYTTKSHPETLLVKQSIDIFSLGCIFYFLNKTHLLYNSEKQLEQLNLTKVCKDIDDEQVSILVKCMVTENDSKRPSITQILENPYLKN
ncbi:kinase-like protein [Rhizophagus irregularis]|uniref:Kinase-like protein n=1 Tax=Rhizophagus irregularis TaxID=588596 RepID=A0A2N0RT90_9GLOM|nr:kinase-like protein [Rhizophagus irregularis]